MTEQSLEERAEINQLKKFNLGFGAAVGAISAVFPPANILGILPFGYNMDLLEKSGISEGKAISKALGYTAIGVISQAATNGALTMIYETLSR